MCQWTVSDIVCNLVWGHLCHLKDVTTFCHFSLLCFVLLVGFCLEYFWPRFDDHFFWDSEVCEEHPWDVPSCVELKVRRSGWWRATAWLPVVKVVAVLAIRNDHMISWNLNRNVTVLHPFWAQGTQTKVSTFHSSYKAALLFAFVIHLVESNGWGHR